MMTTDCNVNDISLIRTYGPDPEGTPKEERKFKSPMGKWHKTNDTSRIKFSDAKAAMENDPCLYFGISPKDAGMIALDADVGSHKVQAAIDAGVIPKPLFTLKTTRGYHLYYRYDGNEEDVSHSLNGNWKVTFDGVEISGEKRWKNYCVIHPQRDLEFGSGLARFKVLYIQSSFNKTVGNITSEYLDSIHYNAPKKKAKKASDKATSGSKGKRGRKSNPNKENVSTDKYGRKVDHLGRPIGKDRWTSKYNKMDNERFASQADNFVGLLLSNVSADIPMNDWLVIHHMVLGISAFGSRAYKMLEKWTEFSDNPDHANGLKELQIRYRKLYNEEKKRPVSVPIREAKRVMKMVANNSVLELTKPNRKALYKALRKAYEEAITDYSVYIFAKMNISVGSVLPKQFQIHMPVVYAEYKKWCKDTGNMACSPQRFHYQMLKTGSRTARRTTFGRKYYTNVTLPFVETGDRRYNSVVRLNVLKETDNKLYMYKSLFFETIKDTVSNSKYNNIFYLYYKLSTDTFAAAKSVARIMREFYTMVGIFYENDPIFCYVPNIYGEDIIKKR